eukprot:9094353-Prorocentrum_lima.AAC.1
MTSSLVGSEMCIRDSWLRLLWRGVLWWCCVACVAWRGLGWSWVSWCLVAVSYTHLTLPTICSV